MTAGIRIGSVLAGTAAQQDQAGLRRRPKPTETEMHPASGTAAVES